MPYIKGSRNCTDYPNFQGIQVVCHLSFVAYWKPCRRVKC